MTDLLDRKNLILLNTLLQNEHVSDEILVDLYEKNSNFEKIEDELWFKLILATSSNPRLTKSYDDRWLDGYAEFQYNHVFTLAWGLFAQLPVNNNTACILSYLAQKLFPEKPHGMDLKKTISRWNVKDEDEYFPYYSHCRYFLAGLISDHTSEFKEMKKDSDLSVRRSYYRRFRPENSSEIRAFFDKDSKYFS